MGLADLFVAKSVEDGKYYGYRPTARRADKSDTLKLIDEVFGKFAFLAVWASTELAKERGKPKGFEKTKYPEGVVLGRFDLEGEDAEFIKNLIGKETYGSLVENLKNYGVRNTLLMNCPPNTSTSILAGVSAGVMPAFNLTQVEDQQTGLFVNFAPLIQYRWFYDTYKNFSSYEDYVDLIDVVARIQRYVDAGISFEITVNHNYFDTPEKLTKLFALVLSESRKKGIKALYYWRHILRDKVVEVDECESCAN
jgi:ribonucleoside-diphosphate reductase alpha chain